MCIVFDTTLINMINQLEAHLLTGYLNIRPILLKQILIYKNLFDLLITL